MGSLLIVGAGPAGLMASGTAAAAGWRVVVAERNDRPARKLMITGKGRCNVTNNCEKIEDLVANVPVNGRFLYSAFSSFMPSDTIRFFESRGVALKTERGNRVFPQSDKATDIVDALVSYANENGTEFEKVRVTDLIIEQKKVKGVSTAEGRTLFADRVIIATGGVSYSATGSTGDGYRLARQAGHSVIEPKPSLVPLNAHDWFCPALQGLSLRNVAVSVYDNKTKKTIFRDFGELLFTHFGISCPIALSASSHMREMLEERYVFEIDLKPALTYEQLDLRILRDFEKNKSRNFINALNNLLPKKMVPVVVKLCGIEPGLRVSQVTKEQRKTLVNILKSFKVTISGFRPIDEAIITSGGIKTEEINPKTMESKLCSGLFFAGEVIDVDAYTGGFNLQIAFSTGYLAGKNL